MSVHDVVLAAPVTRPPFLRRGPGHALLALFGWLAAIIVASSLLLLLLVIASSVVVGAVLGHRLIEFGFGGLVDLYAPEHSVALVCSVILAATFQWLAQIWASRRFARVIGQGNMTAGMGSGPIIRPVMIGCVAVGLCISGAAWTCAVDPSPTFFLRLVDETRGTANLGFGWFWRFAEILLLLQIVILAPAAEEMFFRGWIWTELRRSWAAPQVMLATAVPFIVLHGLEGAWNAIAVLPAAIVLTLARQVGGSVRASMLCHGLYNAGICAVYMATWYPTR